MFPFEYFFRPGKQQQKKLLGVNRACGAFLVIFSQKLLNTHHSEGRFARKSPVMQWANELPDSSKSHSLMPNAASHTTSILYNDTNGFLEHSPSRGSLCYKGPAR